MRDYSIVSAKFWIGETGKRLRGDRDAQLLALYFVTSPHAAMSGLYYCPLTYVSQDIGMPADVVFEKLSLLRSVGFCSYDYDSEVVFVVEMARYQVAEKLELRDNRRTSIVREIAKLRTPLVQLFLDRYAEAFRLDVAVFPPTSGWRPGSGILAALSARDGRTCCDCGTADGLAVDHVVARINGGTNDLSNLRFLCKSCNSKKSAEDRRIFWENLTSEIVPATPSQGLAPTPSEGGARTPSEGGVAKLRHPSRSPDPDPDPEQEQEKGKAEPVARAPASASAAPLSLNFPGGTDEPPEDEADLFTERQQEALDALREISFRVVRWKRQEGTVADILGPLKAHALARDLGGDGFPRVPVRQTIAQAATWSRTNPAKAKTPGGIARFLADWFSREQNRGGQAQFGSGPVAPVSVRGDLLSKISGADGGGRGR